MAKAYVLIMNESGKEDSIISNLRNIPSITTAFGAFGTYDILTKLESPNEENIQHDISNGIRKISNIRTTMTLWVDKKPGISKTNKIEQEVLDTYMAQFKNKKYFELHRLVVLNLNFLIFLQVVPHYQES